MDELTITHWIPAISTTSLTIFAAWLARSLITTRLARSVSHEFDSKIEGIKSGLRQNEAKVEALRSGALSSAAAMVTAQYTKQVEAVDTVWASVLRMRQGRYVAKSMSLLKFEELAKVSPTDSKIREFVKAIGGQVTLEDLQTNQAEKARPYLPPLAWAYFSAYASVLATFVTMRDILVMGLEDPLRYFNPKGVGELVKSVLPHHSQGIDNLGEPYLAELLVELEESLLAELRKVVEGHQSDEQGVRRAHEIMKLSSSLSQSVKETFAQSPKI